MTTAVIAMSRQKVFDREKFANKMRITRHSLVKLKQKLTIRPEDIASIKRMLRAAGNRFRPAGGQGRSVKKS
jgi:hypothetical protein